LYASTNINLLRQQIKEMRSAGHAARRGGLRKAYKMLIRKSEGNRPLGTSAHGLENNINMNLKATACENMEWMHLAQDREQWRALTHTVMTLRVP